MTSKLGALACGVVLGGILGTAPAAAQPRQVRVQLSAPAEYAALLERLGAELRSEGFESEPLAPAAALPCEAPTKAEQERARAEDDARQRHVATIVIRREAEGDELVAELCYAPPTPLPEQARVRASASEPSRFALAVVEALNGLTAPVRTGAEAAIDPRSSVAPETTAPFAVRRLADAERAAAPLAGFVSTGFALAAAGKPMFGASLGLDVPMLPSVALELEVFLPIRAVSIAGDDRELALRSAWARAGVRPAWVWLGTSLGVSLHAGLALVWATATTREPLLIGTTELAAAGIVSGGAWFEAPRDSPLYFRAATHVSRLLPSADVVLGTSTRAFGELSLELGLGVGVRWSRQ